MNCRHTLRQFAAILLVLIISACLPLSAFAEGEELGSITVTAPADGMTYRLYPVGHLENGEPTLDEAYAEFSVDLLDTTAPQTLDALIRAAEIAPAQTAVSEDGEVCFASLPKAIYLINGDPIVVDRVIYTPSPILVEIPSRGEPEWKMDVTVTGKYSQEDVPVEPVKVEVTKVWKNDDKDVRPKAIVVRLLRDGEPYGDDVVLSQANNWHHIWTELPGDSSYSVAEVSVPRGYIVAIHNWGRHFVITNTRIVPPPTHPHHRLPQTGQLWWPVFALGGAGILLLILGVVRRRKQENNG